jgi:hypothetical protein
LTVVTREADDLSPIHALHDLRTLALWTMRDRTPIDFDQFPDLEDCTFEWRRGAESVFRRTSLRRLRIEYYSGRATDAFSGLTNLEELYIASSPVRDLSGLGSLKRLRVLGLYYLTKLETLRGIEGLTALEKLDINTCRKIGSIEEVSSLSGLKDLTLDNCGDIATLRPLEGLPNLKAVGFPDSTNIVDGDMTPLERPGLEVFGFKYRPHYNRRCQNFPGPWFDPAMPRPAGPASAT